MKVRGDADAADASKESREAEAVTTHPTGGAALVAALASRTELVVSIPADVKRGVHYFRREGNWGQAAMRGLADGRVVITDTYGDQVLIVDAEGGVSVVPLGSSPLDVWWRGADVVVIETGDGGYLRLRTPDGRIRSEVSLSDTFATRLPSMYYGCDCGFPLLDMDEARVMHVALGQNGGILLGAVAAKTNACPGAPRVEIGQGEGGLQSVALDGMSLPVEIFRRFSRSWRLEYADASRVLFSSMEPGEVGAPSVASFIAVSRTGRVLASATHPLVERYISDTPVAVAPDGNVYVGVGKDKAFDIYRVGWEIL